MTAATILIVEDDLDGANLLRDLLQKRGYTVDVVGSARACLQRVHERPVDLVITDVQMPEMSGIDLCRHLEKLAIDVPTVMLTGHATMDMAIAAIRAGAFDFVTKPVKVDVLEIVIARALEHVSLKRELARLRQEAADLHGGIVGTSEATAKLIDLIDRVADSDATILITGESGTGKEVVARTIHDKSRRRHEPFVAINCGAMPPNLLESELFGHVKGAFTDASTSRPGVFVQAGRGTILLDEIGEMPLEMQVKLLRAMQERTVRPVGSDREVAIEARILAATNRRLEDEVAARRFREDLYYRINVVAIDVPSLRDRADDILLLAQFFLARAARRTGKPIERISAPAAKLMLAYDWPGNIRELENAIERAVALAKLDEITAGDLPDRVQHPRKPATLELPTELITLDEMERRYIRRVLAALDGNKSSAARVLGIDRRSLYRRLAESTPPPDDVAPADRERDQNAYLTSA
jgi:two-component system response regulator HydG